MNETNRDSLPIRYALGPYYVVSLLIAVLLAVASVAGLVASDRVYPSEELAQSFVANDVANLVIGLPILLGSMWLTRRSRLIGLLFWPGALMYTTYNYIAYVFALPPSWMFLVCISLVALSTYAMIGLVVSLDAGAVRNRLEGAVHVKLSGGTLVMFGAFVLVRGVGVVANGLVTQTAVPAADIAVLVADFLTSPAWILGGVLLWRRRALGYVAGVGLLFQSSMLFVGLVLFLLLQPILTTAAFAWQDLVVVSLMGLVLSIPFALYVRGVHSRD